MTSAHFRRLTNRKLKLFIFLHIAITAGQINFAEYNIFTNDFIFCKWQNFIFDISKKNDSSIFFRLKNFCCLVTAQSTFSKGNIISVILFSCSKLSLLIYQNFYLQMSVLDFKPTNMSSSNNKLHETHETDIKYIFFCCNNII